MTATGPLHVVFCSDRRALPGLHVAAFSLLDRIDANAAGEVQFHLFSDDLFDAEVSCLQASLGRAGKAFTLTRHRIDPARFSCFPALNGSFATYYRLLVPQALEVERFLYVDADTMCDVDVSPLRTLDLGDAPVAWVPEAPLSGAVDRYVAEQLGNRADEFYFNAGVMLVNVPVWHSQRVTEDAMQYLSGNPAQFWDQSALNFILHRRSQSLDPCYNCIANMRPHWPLLRRAYGEIGRLVHFLDYPKPWDFLGEIVHPQHALWQSVLDKTALSNFHSWHSTPARRWPLSFAAIRNYKKLLKDRVLFTAYGHGWLPRVKGIDLV